jgi:hypothetical protein
MHDVYEAIDGHAARYHTYERLCGALLDISNHFVSRIRFYTAHAHASAEVITRKKVAPRCSMTPARGRSFRVSVLRFTYECRTLNHFHAIVSRLQTRMDTRLGVVDTRSLPPRLPSKLG